jgi:hypothetical protein
MGLHGGLVFPSEGYQLLSSVTVDNKQAMAYVPRPELEPFFRTLAVNPSPESCRGGSDGLRSSNSITTASVIYLPILPIDRETGDIDSPSRPTRTMRKLTPDQRAEIRSLARTRSLRDLAASYGVSHETIRTVLKTGDEHDMAAD